MRSDPVVIDNAMKQLQENKLMFKVVNELQDYLPCKIRLLENKKEALLIHGK